MTVSVITGKLLGFQTNAWTGETRNVEIEYVIEPHIHKYAKEGEKVFSITKGGVTGYESFIIEPNGDPLPAMSERGWHACIGTKGRWDDLIIPADEMRKVRI